MENQMYELLSIQPEQKNAYIKENMRIKSNRGMLSKTLSKRERKLLLRIVDDYDIMCLNLSQDCYTNGFLAATQMITANIYREDL